MKKNLFYHEAHGLLTALEVKIIDPSFGVNTPDHILKSKEVYRLVQTPLPKAQPTEEIVELTPVLNSDGRYARNYEVQCIFHDLEGAAREQAMLEYTHVLYVRKKQARHEEILSNTQLRLDQGWRNPTTGGTYSFHCTDFEMCFAALTDPQCMEVHCHTSDGVLRKHTREEFLEIYLSAAREYQSILKSKKFQLDDLEKTTGLDDFKMNRLSELFGQVASVQSEPESQE